MIEDFDRERQANMSDLHKQYDDDMRYIGNYWDLGQTINDLLKPGAAEENPNLEAKWQEYLEADIRAQDFLRANDREIAALVKLRTNRRKQLLLLDEQQNGRPKMDILLTFWFSTHSPVSGQGKLLKQNLALKGVGTMK